VKIATSLYKDKIRDVLLPQYQLVEQAMRELDIFRANETPSILLAMLADLKQMQKSGTLDDVTTTRLANLDDDDCGETAWTCRYADAPIIYSYMLPGSIPATKNMEQAKKDFQEELQRMKELNVRFGRTADKSPFDAAYLKAEYAKAGMEQWEYIYFPPGTLDGGCYALDTYKQWLTCPGPAGGQVDETAFWNIPNTPEWRNRYELIMGRPMPYNPEIDGIDQFGPEAIEFRCRAMTQWFQKMNHYARLSGKKLLVYACGLVGGNGIMSMGRSSGHDYTAQSAYADVLAPEMYGYAYDKPPFETFMICRTDRYQQGKVAPTFMPTDGSRPAYRPVINDLNLIREPLYSYIGSASGFGAFGELEKQYNDQYLLASRTFFVSYPGTVDFYFPRVGVLYPTDIGTTQTSSDAWGWQWSLSQAGFPTRKLTFQDLKDDAAVLAGKYELIVVADVAVLPSVVEKKLTELHNRGVGLIFSGSSGELTEKGNLRKAKSELFPARSEQILCDTVVSNISARLNHPVLDSFAMSKNGLYGSSVQSFLEQFYKISSLEASVPMGVLESVPVFEPRGRVILSMLHQGKKTGPYLMVDDSGSGRIAWMAGRPGVNMIYPFSNFWASNIIPSVAKWAASAAGPSKVQRRSWGIEVYQSKQREEQVYVMIVFNTADKPGEVELALSKDIRKVYDLGTLGELKTVLKGDSSLLQLKLNAAGYTVLCLTTGKTSGEFDKKFKTFRPIKACTTQVSQ
jgi:hypothetical protein